MENNQHVDSLQQPSQFKILSKEEWRQEMLKENAPGTRSDRWAGSGKYRGRSHEVAVRRGGGIHTM